MAIEGFAGVTAIDSSAVVTHSVAAGLVTPPSVAVMLLVPVAPPVAKPLAEMLATERFEEAHVTLFVMFCVVALL
jgi:hypothetical protein